MKKELKGMGPCSLCNGHRHILGLGNLREKCPRCDGIGQEEIYSEAVNEPRPIYKDGLKKAPKLH